MKVIFLMGILEMEKSRDLDVCRLEGVNMRVSLKMIRLMEMVGFNMKMVVS